MRERLRLAALASLHAAQSFALGAVGPFRAASAVAPTRLRIAPPDIRTCDSTVADQIYEGCFSFDGKTVHATEFSPFLIRPPSAAWRRTLTGFSWLRHLRAEHGSWAGEHARAHVAAFLSIRKPEPDDPAFEPGVAARRLISFLSQSPLLLEGAEQEFYERFMAGLGANARALQLFVAGGQAEGPELLLCAIALEEFSICADTSGPILPRATRLLGNELDKQIARDGGHIGRNPQTLLDLLIDLLPLRRVYAARGLTAPETVMRAIDRMIPMLRLLQHGDGALALFNGMGATLQDRLAIVLSHEDSPGGAALDAPYAGYRRLEACGSLVIVDAGKPPPSEYSRAAHAGCLSFEYSIGAERFVVNCGAPPPQFAYARDAARSTAAHSTLILNDRSSCRFALGDGLERLMEGRIVSGPTTVEVERRESNSGHVLEMSHDGYVRDYGLIHERVLALTHDGVRLIGEDRLAAAKGGTPATGDFVLRFHLHPRIAVALLEDGRRVELTAPDGERVVFAASGYTPQIEESIFFAAPQGPVHCTQIVVSGSAKPQTRVRWSFRRIGPKGADVPLSGDM